VYFEGITGSKKSELYRRIKDSGLFPNVIFPGNTLGYSKYIATPSGWKDLLELRYTDPQKYAFEHLFHILHDMALTRETVDIGFKVDIRWPLFLQRSVASTVKVQFYFNIFIRFLKMWHE
jgi:hypothetical protein